MPLKTCTARRRPTTATFIRTPPGGRPGGTPGERLAARFDSDGSRLLPRRCGRRRPTYCKHTPPQLTGSIAPQPDRTPLRIDHPAGKPALPASAPDRPFRLPPAADDSAGAASSNSSDTTAEGPSTSGRLTSVSETRFALLSALFPVPPDTLGAMIAAEPKLRDLPITEVSAALMELRRRLPQCNLETIVCYAPKILFQARGAG